MPRRRLLFLLAGSILAAVVAPAQTLHTVPPIPFSTTGPVLLTRVHAGQPFSVPGLQGVLVGEQQGSFEAWILPIKLLSHLTLEAEVEGYPVPIDLNAAAEQIEVRPDRTTITYSHIAVTVRQIMFAPDAMPPGTGAVVLFQVDAVRPVNLTLRFTPEMRPMWPQRGGGNPSAEWTDAGYYILHTDFPDLAAAIALPGATPGIMAPYQERPQVHPLEFHLHVDPTAPKHLYPLLMAAGRTTATATNTALAQDLATLNEAIPTLYATHLQTLTQHASQLASIQTPDQDLNADLFWAEDSIAKLRARAVPTGEIGLVAGYYESGDSARPGFGWFFGRDTLYTLSAVNAYGDFALTRAALDFLIHRQRPDGKMMHEYSQTAAFLDWASLPYEYAAADATPLFLTAMLDYVHASGDIAFLKSHQDAILRAWTFETTHDADGDGIYDNAQGTGWVESWPPGMPKQEIYLALLDRQASTAMAELAHILGDEKTSTTAQSRALTLRQTIEREYYQPEKDTYAFSRNDGGKLDPTPTIYPAIAWWNASDGLAHPAASLRHWASHDFATDWGLRDIAESDPLYDPISYHQGSVWPLFTGWAAIAQYRSGHPLAGYQALMQNANLTTQQDLGAVTELLSGAFFEPFGRSTPRQLWSSAMVVIPVLRGLFGIEPNALDHSVRVTPHLPADWPSAEVTNLHIGDSVVNLSYHRESGAMLVHLTQVSGPPIQLASPSRTPRPPFEIAIPHTLPPRGSRTAQLKVLNESSEAHSLTLELEAQANSTEHLKLTRNDPRLKPHIEGADLTGDELQVHFNPGTGYVTQTITITW
jgi:hypothetical protein